MDVALLLLHGIVGLLFVGHGLQKLADVAGTAEYMDSLGMRPARAHAAMAGLAELTAGLLLAAGLLLPLAAALVTAVMVTAALTEHRGKGVWNDGGGFELPLVFTVVVFALAAIGGGEVAVDTALGLDVQGLGWAAAALGAGLAGALGNLAVARLAGGRRPAGAMAA